MKLSIASSNPAKDFTSSNFKHFDLRIPCFVQNGDAQHNYDSFIENMKETVKKYKFDFPIAHCPWVYNPNENDYIFQKQVEDAIFSVKACGELGIDRMTIHAGFSFCNNKEEMFDKNVKYFSEILPFAEKYNLTLLVENISEKIYKREFVIETADDILYLRKLLKNHSLMGACWDTGHANVNALDQYANIIKLKGILKGVHLHDNNGYNDDHMTPLLGNVNFDEVIKGLSDISYDGPFNLESAIFNGGDAWPNYRRHYNENSNAKHLLFNPSEDLKIYGLNVMYDVACYMLNRYGIEIE